VWLDVLQAKGEQVAQATRDRTAARKSIMAATAKAASAHAARNPELLDNGTMTITTCSPMASWSGP
jgi:hypothetical protein